MDLCATLKNVEGIDICAELGTAGNIDVTDKSKVPKTLITLPTVPAIIGALADVTRLHKQCRSQQGGTLS